MQHRHKDSTTETDHEFLLTLPKVELHLHIEGTLEGELMLSLARRQGITLPYSSVEEIEAAKEFTNLQSFLDLYYAGTNVLNTSQDFYKLTQAYLLRAQAENIKHTEIFFDPQTHMARGVPFNVIFEGIYSALQDGKVDYGVSSEIIMCFLRHLTEAEGFELLDHANPYLDMIKAVGLDSAELGNPPRKFEGLFAACREKGLLTVAHAGEEGPAEYIWEALNLLGAQRIDHGVRCPEDPELVEYLKETQTPLTVCPLSNVRLKVFESMQDHTLPELIRNELCVTINSDDPSYFGGYLLENMRAVQEAFSLSKEDWIKIATDSVNASFASEARKAELIGLIRAKR